MSFYLTKTTSLSYLLSGLTNTEKEILDRMKAEVEAYMTATEPEGLLKCLASSFNETTKLGFEESVPVLKNFFSFIRHRIQDGSPHEFKRLLVLVDFFLRSCGFRAQVLIGRKKFLDTVYDTAKKYSKVPLSNAQESAFVAVNYLEEWSDSFSDYREEFPYYGEVYNKARMNIRVRYSGSPGGSDSGEAEKPKITIDLLALSRKYPSLAFNS